MPLAQTGIYTEDDYYNLPEDTRAELIDGHLIYNQAAPSRSHQAILMGFPGIHQVTKRLLPRLSCPVCRQII